MAAARRSLPKLMPCDLRKFIRTAVRCLSVSARTLLWEGASVTCIAAMRLQRSELLACCCARLTLATGQQNLDRLLGAHRRHGAPHLGRAQRTDFFDRRARCMCMLLFPPA